MLNEIGNNFSPGQLKSVEKSLLVLAKSAWEESTRLCVQSWSEGEADEKIEEYMQTYSEAYKFNSVLREATGEGAVAPFGQIEKPGDLRARTLAFRSLADN